METTAQKKPRKPAKAKVVVYEPDADMKKWLAECVGVVEATSHEKHSLWKEYYEKHGKDYTQYWFDDRGGYLPTVGEFGGHRVCISLFKAKVEGHWILFMHATSIVVNHDMIEAWLKKAMAPHAFRKGGEYLNSVDATNFHNVLPRAPRADVIEKETENVA